MMFRRMRIWTLDLYKAFRADGLIAAACLVKVWWVVKKADWTFGGILVQICLNRLPVHIRVSRKLDFLWY